MGAGWIWVLLLVEIVVVDALLYWSGNPSLSQWLWRLYRRHWWSRWLVLGGLVVVTLHLVFGWISGPSQPAPSPDEYSY